MAASKLQIYNHALLMMKERRLSGLNEDRESRRTLDEFYDEIVQFCLEQGMWKFAMRMATITQSGSGLYSMTYKFNKPTDIIHTFAVGNTATVDPMVYSYIDEGSFYYANTSPLYVRYSSNDTSYGLDLTRWPQGFTQYVAAELAAWAAYAITGNADLMGGLNMKAKVLLANALSLYSLINMPGQLPMNTGARSGTAAEEINNRPELLPFGTEIKMMASKGQ